MGDVSAKIRVIGITSPSVQVSIDCSIVISPSKQSLISKQCGFDGLQSTALLSNQSICFFLILQHRLRIKRLKRTLEQQERHERSTLSRNCRRVCHNLDFQASAEALADGYRWGMD
ncbi:unnamed protein product [Lactuca virosa]|uniref:Uncharacterized protein n=1 Tax=Lactuca virosa TaxID=75947 RepID=A0AAU9P5B8_9ASTR|nr:unnamed protein product [Lactuca virosa]